MSLYYTGTTYSQVLCKDGTTQNQASSPNARIMDACRNNGGRAVNQPTLVKQTTEVVNVSPTKNRDSISKSLFKKIAGAYNQNLIIAGLLVAGYFAYKKFKK